MKLNFILLSAAFILIQSYPNPINAQDLSPYNNETGWILKSSGKDYKTYYRLKGGSGTHEVMLIGLTEKKPAKVIAAITDYNNFPEFMPYVIFSNVVNSEKLSDNKYINYVFTFLKVPIPFVSPRFYNLKYTDVYCYNGNPDKFRSDWILEKGAYRKTPNDPDLRPFINNPAEAVETTFNQGYFFVEPAEASGKTRIVYYVWTNPGGSLPAAAVNIANAVALPKLLNAINQRALKY